MSEIYDKLSKLNGRLLSQEPMSAHTGFKTGGLAKYMFFPSDREALCAALSVLDDAGEKHIIIGNGSNLLAPDSGYDGVVICTCDMNNVSFEDPDMIRCGAGAQLKELCMCALEHSLSGAEFAYGIPGTVGGAVFMNAGAYGGEISDIFMSAEVIEGGKLKNLTPQEADFSYRTSAFQSRRDAVILSVCFRLLPGNAEEIHQKMKQNLNSRREKQPLNYPSCGSTFRRPVGGYASALIDECGLKGYSIGGAMVSEKHAGFLINYDSATSKDVLELIDYVSKTVREKTGVELKPEIEILE